MNINVPNIVNAALGDDAKNRNVRVISDNMNRGIQNDPGFLSKDFPRGSPKLYFSAESDDFDELTLAEWKAEGFNVEYIPMGDDLDDYRRRLEGLSRKRLGPCETFGIVGRLRSTPSVDHR